MPSQPLWLTNLPQILEAIEGYPETLDRTQVEKLLDVKPRTAQDLINTAGGSLEGNRFVIPREDFAQFLRIKGGPQLDAEEKHRRRKFAGDFARMERDFIERPRLLVDASLISKADLKRARKGTAGLPAGVSLSPGCIVIACDSGIDATQKLMLLSMAIGSDFEGFEEAINNKSVMEQSSAPAREGTGVHARTKEVA